MMEGQLFSRQRILGTRHISRALLSAVLAVLASAVPSRAAGGACPSGPNYLNTSSNSLVTLASLGVTNCYYVSAQAGASDSNNETTEALRGFHAPHMPNCSGICATVQNATMGLLPTG
jgi:hypothetical protein